MLGSGRCGTTTVARAFAHADNYTAGHETRAHEIHGRVDYPDGHIEVDNRLAWFLGPLDAAYGDDPVYVRLDRDRDATIRSYARRFRGPRSIVRAMARGILIPDDDALAREPDWPAVSALVIDTVYANVDLFLRDKSKVVDVTIDDDPADGFETAWTMLGCTGDLDAARAELDVRHNRTPRSAKR